MINFKNITKIFGKNTILNNFNLILPDSGLIFLTGENGSGKTTLLNILSLNDSKFKGELYFDDIDIAHLRTRERQNLKRDYISYVTQKNNLISFLNKDENKNFNKTFTAIDKKISNKKERKTKANNLSEGEQAIIALTNYLEPGKKIYILDEIFSALDEDNQQEVINKILELKKGALVIVVSHSVKIKEISDLVIHLIKNNSPKITIQNKALSYEKTGFVVNNKVSKFPYRLMLKSFKSSLAFKIGFSLVSLICLSFCMVGTTFYTVKPEYALTQEARNLNSIYLETDLVNTEILYDKYKDNLTQEITTEDRIFIKQDKETRGFCDTYCIDEDIDDINIHVSPKFAQIFFEEFHVKDFDNCFVYNEWEKRSYPDTKIVIDNNIKRNHYYIGRKLYNLFFPKFENHLILRRFFWDNNTHYAEYYIKSGIITDNIFINEKYLKEKYPDKNITGLKDNVIYVDSKEYLTNGYCHFIEDNQINSQLKRFPNYNIELNNLTTEYIESLNLSEKYEKYFLVTDNTLNRIKKAIDSNNATYYLWLDKNNINDVFNLAIKKKIPLFPAEKYTLDNVPIKKEKFNEISLKYKSYNAITMYKLSSMQSTWISELSILIFISYALISIILLTSITIISKNDMKVLKKNGLMPYEIYGVINGPYYLIIVASMFIAKLMTLYLANSINTFGGFYFFLPLNFLIYFGLFILMNLINYLVLRKELK